MTPFKTLQIPQAQRYWIRQARVPICFLLGGPKTDVDRDGATLVDLLVDKDRITAIEPAGGEIVADLPAINLESRHVWPTLIDMHAHLDKGHIVTRAENPEGSFAGALQSVAEDRTRWTAEDIKRRMEFGLRCAYTHGVAAIRTHLDAPEPDQAIRFWPSSLSTVPRMRVGVPAVGVWASAGPIARAMRAAIATFRIIQTPCFHFSRGDSQEWRTRTGLSAHIPVSGGRAVRKAGNGNPSSSRVPLAMVQPKARGSPPATSTLLPKMPLPPHLQRKG
jgi:hypothetical protein